MERMAQFLPRKNSKNPLLFIIFQQVSGVAPVPFILSVSACSQFAIFQNDQAEKFFLTPRDHTGPIVSNEQGLFPKSLKDCEILGFDFLTRDF